MKDIVIDIRVTEIGFIRSMAHCLSVMTPGERTLGSLIVRGNSLRVDNCCVGVNESKSFLLYISSNHPPRILKDPSGLSLRIATDASVLVTTLESSPYKTTSSETQR